MKDICYFFNGTTIQDSYTAISLQLSRPIKFILYTLNFLSLPKYFIPAVLISASHLDLSSLIVTNSLLSFYTLEDKISPI